MRDQPLAAALKQGGAGRSSGSRALTREKAKAAILLAGSSETSGEPCSVRSRVLVPIVGEALNPNARELAVK